MVRAIQKENPPDEGASRGSVLRVERLQGNTNYSKVRAAVQGSVDMVYDFATYKLRTDLDDWFSVYGLVNLTKAEYFVLRFIIARTVHYGKTSEIIFKNHFLSGVQAGGEWKTAPCGVNSRDLYAAIASLEEKKLVETSRVTDGKRHLATLYKVNVEAILTLRGKPRMALKIPKKQARSMVPTGTDLPAKERCQLAPKKNDDVKTKNNDVGCPETTGNVRRKVRSGFKPIEIDCNSKAKVEAVLLRATTRTTAKQVEKVRRGRGAAPADITLTDLNATWKRCVVAHAGSCSIVGLTHKEYGIFKKIVKTHDIRFQWEDFFTWLIPSWNSINSARKEQVAYHRKRTGEWSLSEADSIYLSTSTPQLSSVVRNLNKLMRMYIDRTSYSPARVESADVSGIKAELAAARREAQVATALMNKALHARATPVAAPKKAASKPLTIIVNPEEDDYYDRDEEALPDWKDQA